jgi:hypothetical protein
MCKAYITAPAIFLVVLEVLLSIHRVVVARFLAHRVLEVHEHHGDEAGTLDGGGDEALHIDSRSPSRVLHEGVELRRGHGVLLLALPQLPQDHVPARVAVGVADEDLALETTVENFGGWKT